MDKVEHGLRLKAAMAAKRLARDDIATATGVKVRTVTNWTSGATMPSDRERAVLRRLLGDYDDPGDPVEAAIWASRLTEDRGHVVLGVYKRELRQQDEEAERGRSA
jgi:transcriptional regulator with XRE-family HTH domain